MIFNSLAKIDINKQKYEIVKTTIQLESYIVFSIILSAILDFLKSDKLT